jgi:hypothetical protein
VKRAGIRTAKFLVLSESDDPALAEKTLREIVKENPALIAFTGKDCRKLEDLCDAICEESPAGSRIVTSCHPDEPLAHVTEFVRLFQGKEDLGEEFLLVTI